MIDIKKNSKPDTDNYKNSEFLKWVSKLSENRDQIRTCKPENHIFFEIIRQVYLNSFYSATAYSCSQW